MLTWTSLSTLVAFDEGFESDSASPFLTVVVKLVTDEIENVPPGNLSTLNN
jgi:hypothetical protein